MALVAALAWNEGCGADSSHRALSCPWLSLPGRPEVAIRAALMEKAVQCLGAAALSDLPPCSHPCTRE